MSGITTKELLEMVFHEDYEKLKGKKLRMTRVRRLEKKSAWHMYLTRLRRAFIRILDFISVCTKGRIIQGMR